MWVPQKQYRIVGEILAAARLRADQTQQELADTLAKPQSFVSSYERGQRRIDLLELIAIAEALRQDPVAIFAQVSRAHTRRKVR